MRRSINTQTIISLTNDTIVRATFNRFHTVTSYLRRRGVPQTWIIQWGSAFGRKAAAVQRQRGIDSVSTTWEDGRRVAVYADTVALDTAMAHYAAHKTAGPQLGAGYDRSRAAKRQLRDHLGRFARVYVVSWTGPVGANSRGRLTAERAARLAHALITDHRMSAVIVRDAQGHRVDVALCA
jgi:hypothetical protein